MTLLKSTKIWNHIFILHGLPKCLFKCHIFLSWAYIDRNKFLLSTSWCSSVSEQLFAGSQIFFLAKRENIHPALLLFPILFLPRNGSYMLRRCTCSHGCRRCNLVSTDPSCCTGFPHQKFPKALTTHILDVDPCLMVALAGIHAYLIHIFLFAWLSLAQ